MSDEAVLRMLVDALFDPETRHGLSIRSEDLIDRYGLSESEIEGNRPRPVEESIEAVFNELLAEFMSLSVDDVNLVERHAELARLMGELKEAAKRKAAEQQRAANEQRRREAEAARRCMEHILRISRLIAFLILLLIALQSRIENLDPLYVLEDSES